MFLKYGLIANLVGKILHLGKENFNIFKTFYG